MLREVLLFSLYYCAGLSAAQGTAVRIAGNRRNSDTVNLSLKYGIAYTGDYRAYCVGSDNKIEITQGYAGVTCQTADELAAVLAFGERSRVYIIAYDV